MIESFSIKSNRTDRELVFYNSENSNYFSVKLQGSITTELRVYAYSPHEGNLKSWFILLGSKRKPWNGELTWQSLEGEFEIMATCNTTGSVCFEITLNIDRFKSEDSLIKTGIVSELGALKNIGSKARDFFK